MATQVSPTIGNKDLALGSSKSLVSTKAFNGEFYTYVTSLNANFQTVGTFSLVSGASASVCPAGRILHLTGRKLYPDVNPMNTFVGALSSPKFLVSVYDPISFLSGFIDPTSNTFAKFDQNLPNFFDLGTSGAGVEWSGGGEGADVHVIDSGVLSTVIGANSSLAAKNASVGAFTIVAASTVATRTITVNTTVCTANSRVFLTQASAGTANLTSVVLTSTVAGSFVVTYTVSTGNTAADVTFNWFIVN